MESAINLMEKIEKMAVTLEERVGILEAKMEKVLAEKQEQQPEAPWWEQMFGAFKDSADYESAMRRGAEYRRTQKIPHYQLP